MRSSLDSPIYGLDDIYDNKVVTIRYRDPTYPDGFIFEAKPLPGAIDPPNVLAPESRPSNYRPQIGFTRNIGQASLGDSGHRMVNHHSGGYKHHQQQQYNQYNNDNRNFASIAPPNNYRQHSKLATFFCSASLSNWKITVFVFIYISGCYVYVVKKVCENSWYH